jgi:hypothetical protein
MVIPTFKFIIQWHGRDKSKNYLCEKGAYSQPGFRLHMCML